MTFFCSLIKKRLIFHVYYERNDFLKRTLPPYPQPPPKKNNNNELDLFLSSTKVRAFDILLHVSLFFLLKTEKNCIKYIFHSFVSPYIYQTTI